MKNFFSFIVIVTLLLAGLLVFRAMTVFENNQVQISEPFSRVTTDQQGALERFAKAISIPTISHESPEQFDAQAFRDFHQHLAMSFPLVHAQSNWQTFADYSLLYHFKGSNPELNPVLFMGHMDVVPIDQNTLDQWQQPPFSGAIVDQTIWGRGTIDDKVTVLALLEAMESLLAQDVLLKRDIYFAFGHDEEVGGWGATTIAKHFKAQGLKFEFVLDEGGVITEGLIPSTTDPIALIGVAEKGFVNFRLTVNDAGGHSSQPPANTAAGVLAKALVKLEDNQFATNMAFFGMIYDAIGYSTSFKNRLAMSNLWLLSPLVEPMIINNPSTAASARTTTAITMLEGSNKSNVLPTQASAVVNFRILPGDTIADIQQHLRSVINDPRVQLESFMGNEASAVSSTNTLGFKLIEQTIRQLDSKVLVAPYLVLGATDSRHFYQLSDNIYRFMMVRLNPKTMKGFHGINEKIAVQDYLQAIQFYSAMLKQSGQTQALNQ